MGGLILQLPMNYGSRDEITRAARKLAKDCAAGKVNPDTIDESLFNSYLDTNDIPDPDLMIRTSGEQRLSELSALAAWPIQSFILQIFRGRHLRKKSL